MWTERGKRQDNRTAGFQDTGGPKSINRLCCRSMSIEIMRQSAVVGSFPRSKASGTTGPACMQGVCSLCVAWKQSDIVIDLWLKFFNLGDVVVVVNYYISDMPRRCSWHPCVTQAHFNDSFSFWWKMPCQPAPAPSLFPPTSECIAKLVRPMSDNVTLSGNSGTCETLLRS